jgi:hypothetical protein
MPLTWFTSISDEDYSILNVVNTASKVLGFTMIRSFVFIIKTFEMIYPDREELIEKLLSFIITFYRPFCFPD